MVQNLEQSSAFSLTGSPKQVSYRVTPCHLRESAVHYSSNKSVTQENLSRNIQLFFPLSTVASDLSSSSFFKLSTRTATPKFTP